MPKFIPNYHEWAFTKYCHYCGKLFYPVEDSQDFCDLLCQSHWREYTEDIEAFWIKEMIDKEDLKNGKETIL